MIIDFHTHCFIDKIADKALAVLESNSHQKSRIGPRLSDLENSMVKAKIDCSVVLNIATNVMQTKNVNDFAIKLLEVPNIIPFGSVHPGDPNYVAELERLKSFGIKGIKFHPHYQGVFIDDPSMIRAVRTALAMDFVVILHAGVDVGLREVNYALPVASRKLIDSTGSGKLVLAHLGGYENFAEVEEYLVGTNVYLDTSYVLGVLPQEQMLRIIKKHGVERILFGTDSPWVDAASYVDNFQKLPLTDKERAMIMCENAKKLLEI